MSSLKEFQTEHGAQWNEIVATPAFASALATSTEEKLRQIASLTDDEIQTKSQVYLADLRGHLLYETGLLGLHEKKELVFQDIGEEQYADPVQEALELSIEEKQIASGVKPETTYKTDSSGRKWAVHKGPKIKRRPPKKVKGAK